MMEKIHNKGCIFMGKQSPPPDKNCKFPTVSATVGLPYDYQGKAFVRCKDSVLTYFQENNGGCRPGLSDNAGRLITAPGPPALKGQ